MSSRSKQRTPTSARLKKTSPRAAHRRVHVISDFDNTMIPVNTAAMFVWHYLSKNPHHEPLYRRMRRVACLASPGLRSAHFSDYYECLRRIPAPVRERLLARVHVSERWLRAIKQLRLKRRARTIAITILTRNCVDVVHAWVMQNRDILRKQGVEVEAIIANGPLAGPQAALVRERADLAHIDYVGFGQMMEREKRAFVNHETIYIGDVHERLLKPLVREFIQV